VLAKRGPGARLGRKSALARLRSGVWRDWMAHVISDCSRRATSPASTRTPPLGTLPPRCSPNRPQRAHWRLRSFRRVRRRALLDPPCVGVTRTRRIIGSGSPAPVAVHPLMSACDSPRVGGEKKGKMILLRRSSWCPPRLTTDAVANCVYLTSRRPARNRRSRGRSKLDYLAQIMPLVPS